MINNLRIIKEHQNANIIQEWVANLWKRLNRETFAKQVFDVILNPIPCELYVTKHENVGGLFSDELSKVGPLKFCIYFHPSHCSSTIKPKIKKI